MLTPLCVSACSGLRGEVFPLSLGPAWMRIAVLLMDQTDIHSNLVSIATYRDIARSPGPFAGRGRMKVGEGGAESGRGGPLPRSTGVSARGTPGLL